MKTPIGKTLMEMREGDLRNCLCSLIDDLFGYDDEEDGRCLTDEKEWGQTFGSDVMETLSAYGLRPENHDPSPIEDIL